MGISTLRLPERATLSNMCPEYGATTTLFPIDDETLAVSRADRPRRAAGEARRGLRQGAGPVARRGARAAFLGRGGDRSRHGGAQRVPVPSARRTACRSRGFPTSFRAAAKARLGAEPGRVPDAAKRRTAHGDVVIAAITSCTNTSNPSVMLAAGLLRRRPSSVAFRPSPGSRRRLRPAHARWPTTSPPPACRSRWTRWATSLPATAAPPAWATPARSRPR